MRTSPRRWAGALALALAAITLTACEKPTPVVGMLADGHYTNTEASIWCFGKEAYTGPGSCTERDVAPPKLKVRTGEQVSIEVSKEVVDRGWYVAVATPPEEGSEQAKNGVPDFQRGGIQRDRSYFSFTVPTYGTNEGIAVQVVALGPGEANSGIWQFVLLNPEAGT